MYDLKNHTQGTSGGALKICRRNLKKNQFLLIFDDFGENVHFCPNFWFCGEHCWGHKIVGNRQSQEKNIKTDRKLCGDNFRYP